MHVCVHWMNSVQKGISFPKVMFGSHSYNFAGEDVAFYFAWMNFYSTYILVPALVGVVMYFARGASTTVDTDPYLPFYSVFMAIWAVLFLVVSKGEGGRGEGKGN